MLFGSREELDRFKKGNDALAYNARGFVRTLDRLSDKKLFYKSGVEIGKGLGTIKVELNHPFPEELRNCFRDDIQDHRIIATAMWVRDNNPDRFVALVTKDINMRLKAKAVGMEVQDYLTDRLEEERFDQAFKEVQASEILIGMHMHPNNSNKFWGDFHQSLFNGLNCQIIMARLQS